MKKRTQLDAVREIAHIRALQLERARVEAQKLAGNLGAAQARDHLAEQELEAHMQGLRGALEHPETLSPELVQNWACATAAARDAHTLAAGQLQAAAEQVEAFRPVLGQHQRQVDLARDLVDHARRRYEQARDNANASVIEDLFLSRGVRR
ncbi:hypothetical protein FAZ69_11025 [Trinickia terrae]|uniref:Flagellar FliJ protein n=1 Tax=Trinickia terrae TaxID=2571161 RepID=A0A4U1I7Q6_9BURK|nr:hypothetical protein [Trinickia terrae]TKC89456.1 hypothetical protein FAZ69_11025 [Trinickia terrae]